MSCELEVRIRAADRGSNSWVVLAEASSEIYEPRVIDEVFSRAVILGRLQDRVDSAGENVEFQVRVLTGGGMRACLNLQSVTVGRIAAISGALNLDPKVVESSDANQEEMDRDVSPLHRPELVVKLVGDSPVTGKEMVLWRTESEWFEPCEVEERVREVLSLGMSAVHGDARAWALQVSISLASDRGVRPAFVLSRDAITAMAAYGASLDFDPYV